MHIELFLFKKDSTVRSPKLHQITSKESVELLYNKYQEKQELEQLQNLPKIKESIFTVLTCPNQIIKNETIFLASPRVLDNNK